MRQLSTKNTTRIKLKNGVRLSEWVRVSVKPISWAIKKNLYLDHDKMSPWQCQVICLESIEMFYINTVLCLIFYTSWRQVLTINIFILSVSTLQQFHSHDLNYWFTWHVNKWHSKAAIRVSIAGICWKCFLFFSNKIFDQTSNGLGLSFWRSRLM